MQCGITPLVLQVIFEWLGYSTSKGDFHICTLSGLFEWLSMTFSLKMAPRIYQPLVDNGAVWIFEDW